MGACPGKNRCARFSVVQAFALKNNMALFEISAKSDPEDYVESIFLALVVKLQQAIQKEELNQPKVNCFLCHTTVYFRNVIKSIWRPTLFCKMKAGAANHL